MDATTQERISNSKKGGKKLLPLMIAFLGLCMAVWADYVNFVIPAHYSVVFICL